MPIRGETPCHACFLWSALAFCWCFTSAQDAATGAIRGTVLDASGSRLAQATVAVVNSATGARYAATSRAEGRFMIDLLPPGDYTARTSAENVSKKSRECFT